MCDVTSWVPIRELSSLTLSSEEIHVWKISSDSRVPIFLTGDEKCECEEIKNEVFRAQYIKRRSAFRRLAACYLKKEPLDFDIEYSGNGKPLFSHADLQFSVSHSADEMVVAFCSSTAIGIDIESGVRLQNPLAIAERYFSAEEYKFLQQTDDNLLKNAFLRLWVCKEAALKSSGHGLSGGLPATRVRFEEQSRVSIHRGVDGKQVMGMEFIPTEGFRGALVAESPESLENVKWFVLS